MTVKTDFNDKICTMTVDGNIDTMTSSELEQAVAEAAVDCEKLILDFAGVEYISSAGIRAVLEARRIVGGDNLTLKNLNANVKELFRITGFTKVLNIV